MEARVNIGGSGCCAADGRVIGWWSELGGVDSRGDLDGSQPIIDLLLSMMAFIEYQGLDKKCIMCEVWG